ncbi:MAG: hypothetical protein WD048_06960 [Chitinophagales bacterium]
MENYNLRVPENSNKAKALIEYLKTLDFIEFKKSRMLQDEPSEIEQKLIDQGFDDLRNNKLIAHQEVKQSIRERIKRSQ